MEVKERNIKSIHYSTVYSNEYEWVIKNPALYSFNTRYSPDFVTENCGCQKFKSGSGYKPSTDTFTWTIKLVLKKNQPLEIFLILKDFQEDGYLYTKAIIKCAFQIKHGNVTNNSILEFTFNAGSLESKPLEGITIKQEDLNNSDLTISVSLIEVDSENESIETKHKKLNFTVPMPELNLSNDFKNLISSEELSDFTLESKTKKFKVHKTILASRSPYFMTAIKTDMKEKQENKINMSEEDNVIEELLNYIYTDQIENTELAKDLFIAADKYQLEGLKKICIYHLYKNVNIENAIEWLLFADKYNSKEFENHVMKFIIFYINEISKIDSFKSLSEIEPRLAQVLNCLI